MSSMRFPPYLQGKILHFIRKCNWGHFRPKMQFWHRFKSAIRSTKIASKSSNLILKIYCYFVLYFVLHFFRVDDIDSLLHFVESSNLSISDVIIDDNRRRHVTILMSERGSWTTGNTEASNSLGLNKENKLASGAGYQNRLLKRSIKRSKSVINMFISTSSHSKELEQKAKNIKQTENLITLRDAILRVANYFFSADPNSMPTDPDLADELQVKVRTFYYITLECSPHRKVANQLLSRGLQSL